MAINNTASELRSQIAKEITQPHFNLGKKRTAEQRAKMSAIRKKNPNRYWLGKQRPNIQGSQSSSWKGGEVSLTCVQCDKVYSEPKCSAARSRFCSRACRAQYHHSGAKCHLWRGGITPVNQKIRHSIEYKLWRIAVFERDGYQCVVGGKNHSSKLNADHIKPFAWFPELRFAIDNGRTLCVDCHKATDTYGARLNKLQKHG